MFQLSLKILLAVLMFVDLAFTVPVEDLSNHSTKPTQVVIKTDTGNTNHENEHANNTDQVDRRKESSKDVDKTVTFIDLHKNLTNEEAPTKTSATLQNSSLTPVLGKKEDHINQHSTKRPVEETTPINQIPEIINASNLTGEPKDLIESSVSPRDEEDVTTVEPIQNKPNSSVSTVTVATSSTTLKSVNETTVDDVPVENEKHSNESIDGKEHVPVQNKKHSNESIDGKEPVPVQNEKHKEKIDSERKENIKNATNTNTSGSINVPTETTTSSNAASKSTEVTTDVSSKNDQVEVGNSTETVQKEKEVVEQVAHVKSKPLSTNEEDTSMPAGIIVLVTALSFAVAIVVGYISTVIWKQYLEHRYGRRELLVNELEFDTNDLRHFEL